MKKKVRSKNKFLNFALGTPKVKSRNSIKYNFCLYSLHKLFTKIIQPQHLFSNLCARKNNLLLFTQSLNTKSIKVYNK